MIDALAAGTYAPPPDVAKTFAQRRVNAISKALSMDNLFVPASGQFSSPDPNATFTVYTKPLQRDVIVMGCALMSADERADNRLSGEFRVRLPEPLAHLSQNYIFPAMAFAPATYSVFFPTPFILRAGEQMAVDFGQNAPQAGESNLPQPSNEDTNTRIEIVFFCVSVKNCLASDDVQVLNRAIQVINDTPYQRKVFLNSWTHGSVAVTSQTNSPFQSGTDNMVVYPQQPLSTVLVPKGSLTSSETRQADAPLLVVGLAIASCGSTVRFMDTGSGHSFTQGEWVYAHSMYYPEEFLSYQTVSPYYSYFRLPVPHLLRPGATLYTEHLASRDCVQNVFNPEQLVWECLSV